MPEYDEAILRGRRVLPQAPFPALHQALRIALYDACAARAFGARVIAAFGAQAPFVKLAAAEERTVATLTALCERYGVPRPFDPFPGETTLAPGWRANLERAIAGELASIQLYQELRAQVRARDVRRSFTALQAEALDDHLPALRRALATALARERYHAAQGVPADQAYTRHGPLTNLLEQGISLLSGQHGAAGIAGPLLRAAKPGLLVGLLAGGATAYYLRQRRNATHDHANTHPEEED
ncbi:ferritin [Rhodocyclus tenuis]|uniref:ferritin n=1 Tax=Rhodocyclus tenuis TaxID=1066 RepID=UPI001908EAD5|nr:ferritin [Rhodocyclus tenuis]